MSSTRRTLVREMAKGRVLLRRFVDGRNERFFWADDGREVRATLVWDAFSAGLIEGGAYRGTKYDPHWRLATTT